MDPGDVTIDAPHRWDGQRLRSTERGHAATFFEARYKWHCEQMND
jgi:hypothetical protein